MASTLGVRELLPTNVKPTHYNLELEPVFETSKVYGHVAIDIDVLEDSTQISLHTLDIELKAITLKDSEISNTIEDIRYDEKTHVTTFGLKNLIKKGSKSTLDVEFVSSLNGGDKKAGFFRGDFEFNGEKQPFAVSQMEPVDARRVFPCFDEPALKATFDIALIADKHMTSLSNGKAISSEELDNGKTKTIFNRIPPMSTYLTAFIVAKLEYIESHEFRIPLRIYTHPGQTTRAKFSLDLTVKVLSFFEETFDCEFPLPKLDQVAIAGFMGGMENWGLVIYHPNSLLVDPKNPSIQSQQAVARSVAHELAHQWFGNIVTMRFWDSLWLNEGFAEWAAWFCADRLHPEWNYWRKYQYQKYSEALEADSVKSSHPIEVPILKASMINQIFDAISYSKGSAVIRMIANYLGEDIFLKGVASYLRKHAYSNTLTKDLWLCLSEASAIDVEKTMSIWTKKTGYPVVTVTESEGGITVKQNRFLQSGPADESEDEVLYPVFLRIKTKDFIIDETLDSRSKFIPINDLEFFKINTQHFGLYRTLYTPERFAKLAQSTKQGTLSPEDRMGIVFDSTAFSASGYLQTPVLLDFLSELVHEDDTFVWNTMFESLQDFSSAWKYEGEEILGGITSFRKSLYSSRVNQIGWDFDPNDDSLLVSHKATIFGNAGTVGVPKVIEAVKIMFSAYMSGDKEAINPNILSSVMSSAVRYGGKEEFNQVLEQVKLSKIDIEVSAMLVALGATKDVGSIKSLLENLALSQEILGKTVITHVLSELLGSPLSFLAWDWFRTNYDLIFSKTGDQIYIMTMTVKLVISSLGTAEHIKQVKKYFFENGKLKSKFEGQSMGIQQGLETLEAKVKWVERDRQVVEHWLKNKGWILGRG